MAKWSVTFHIQVNKSYTSPKDYFKAPFYVKPSSAAAAAKSLQSCPTLCNPIDSSSPSWDSLGKNTGVGCHFLPQCMKVKSESEVAQRVRLFSTPWTAAHQAPPPMGFSRQEYWSGVPLPSPNYLETSPKIEFTIGMLVFSQIVLLLLVLYCYDYWSFIIGLKSDSATLPTLFLF